MWRGQEGSTGDKGGMRRASAQDPLSLEIQGDGVITESLMLDGDVLKDLRETETCMFVCRRN